MNKWEIDVAVLCIFFARPEQFCETFEQVRKARPRVLLLWQDGPREGSADDMENILKCRKIAENIDWDCEVYTNYHEKNMGCDPSTFYSHKWAFSIADKCIILEDDFVASQSFFTFCKEMLDRYEYDTRIDRICGTNLLGEYDIPYDYFFSGIGNSGGWASWRRVAQKWQEDYRFIQNEYAVSRMRALQPKQNEKGHRAWEDSCRKHQAEGVPYWEYIIGAENLLNHRLCIYPSRNMISNIGLDANSTHSPASLDEVPKSVRQFFNRKTYEIDHPLRHPDYVIDDKIYVQLCQQKMKGSPAKRVATLMERVWLKLKR